MPLFPIRLPRVRWLPLISLAACQPLPHPFAADVPPARSPVLSPRDSAGVVVAPVAGAPAPIATALAEAIASALRDAEIPASSRGPGNRGSYRLAVLACEKPGTADRSVIAIDWELRSAGGKLLGRGAGLAEEPRLGWRRGDEGVASDVAGKTAPAVARLIQDEPPTAVPVVEPLLAVRRVTGAPGDGGTALVRAMDFALRRSRVALADKTDDKESLVLTGKVELSPPASGKQRVRVSWALLGADGREIGQVSQENAVPAGSLDRAWGDIAFAVANAAAPAIVALVARAKAAGS